MFSPKTRNRSGFRKCAKSQKLRTDNNAISKRTKRQPRRAQKALGLSRAVRKSQGLKSWAWLCKAGNEEVLERKEIGKDKDGVAAHRRRSAIGESSFGRSQANPCLHMGHAGAAGAGRARAARGRDGRTIDEGARKAPAMRAIEQHIDRLDKNVSQLPCDKPEHGELSVFLDFGDERINDAENQARIESIRACPRCRDTVVIFFMQFGKPLEPAPIDVTPAPRHEPAPINFVNFNFGVDSKPEPHPVILRPAGSEDPVRKLPAEPQNV